MKKANTIKNTKLTDWKKVEIKKADAKQVKGGIIIDDWIYNKG